MLFIQLHRLLFIEIDDLCLSERNSYRCMQYIILKLVVFTLFKRHARTIKASFLILILRAGFFNVV